MVSRDQAPLIDGLRGDLDASPPECTRYGRRATDFFDSHRASLLLGGPKQIFGSKLAHRYQLKPRFNSNVKPSFIPIAHHKHDHQAMLDGKELARRLRDAMDKATPRITSSQLARKCEVTPQAVNGWRARGMIAKKHLPVISRLTGKPIAYFLEDGQAAKQPEGQYTFEANRLLDDYHALPEGLKEHLARKAAELRAYVEALPPFLRQKLQPPTDWEEYKQFERELEADMAQRLHAEQPKEAPKR